MIPIRRLHEADYYDHLEMPHNPPESDLGESAFDAEYYRLYEGVADVLARHGENNAYGDGDYYLEPRVTASRGIGLEITNAGLVTPGLITELAAVIRRVDPRWEVYLGSGDFDFGIFVSATEARVWKGEDSSLGLEL